MEIKLSHLLLIAILVFGFLIYTGALQIQFREAPTEGETPTAGLVTVNKPLDFFVYDKYAGGAVASATVAIYDASGQLLESLTSGSDGTVQSGASYTSGEKLYIKVSKSSYVTAWIPYTVPKLSPADAESLSVISVKVPIVDQDNWVIQVRDSLGNTYSDNGNWNKTAGGSSTPGTSVATMLIDVFQQNDNSGWVDSYDPINKQDWKLVLEVKISGTGYENVIVTSGTYDYYVQKGSAMYYLFVLDPYQATRHVSGNTVLSEGTVTKSIRLDLSSYSGDTADIAINVYMYADPAKFVNMGTYGPDRTSVATEFNLNIVD